MKYNPFLYNLPLSFGVMFVGFGFGLATLGYGNSGKVFGVVGLLLLGLYDYTLQRRFGK